MCGRFGFFHPAELGSRFGVAGQLPLLEASYNVAPGQMHPVVVGPAPAQVNIMKWGLIPFWSKDSQVGYKMINARAEGIQDKPSYRKPIRSQRCLVPADGFYEWKRTSRDGKEVKVPHFIHLKDQGTFAFAGLYDLWRDAEGHDIATFSIVTTEPNELTATIHNRMPVILARENEGAWLDPGTPLPQVLGMLGPYPAAEMAAYPVANLVNNVRSNGPELIKGLEG